MASACGTLTLLSPVPGSDTIIAGVALKGLWANNRGSSWVHLGTGDGDRIASPSSIVYDPAHAGVFWMTGIYDGGGVFQTIDNGITFRRLGSISHIDSVSINFRDPDRQTLLAGGHEQAQTVYESTNGGQTWTNIGLTLPPDTGTNHPLIVSSIAYVVNGQGGAKASGGIYRTTNAGTSWRRVSTQGPSGQPLVTSSGAIYWPVDGGLLKSTDSGSTWTRVGTGVRPIHPLEMPDRRLVAVGASNLIISADGGSTWSPFGGSLPFAPTGVIYSPSRRSFFIWHSDCRDTVPSDAVMQIQ
jgi:photosystem II stability/assembly factor-like uncharacterized protein